MAREPQKVTPNVISCSKVAVHNRDRPHCITVVMSYRIMCVFYFQVKVIFGDDRERVGTLINIDDPDGIIKMDQTDQLKILPLKYLAKLGPTNI